MKKEEPKPKKENFREGYDIEWMKKNPDHPDYKKVFPDEKK